jgi:hypothetical protein
MQILHTKLQFSRAFGSVESRAFGSVKDAKEALCCLSRLKETEIRKIEMRSAAQPR